MSATITQTQTVPQPEIIRVELKVRPLAIQAIVEKLLTCTCFDATAKNEIRQWQEYFQKNFPAVPNDEDEKEEAALALCGLYVKYIRPNCSNNADCDALYECCYGVERNLENYLPENTNVDAFISEYEESCREKNRFERAVASSEDAFENFKTKLGKESREIEEEIDKQLEQRKKEIEALIKLKKDNTTHVHQQVSLLDERMKKIVKNQLSAGLEQGKIISSINAVLSKYKTNNEQALNLSIKG